MQWIKQFLRTLTTRESEVYMLSLLPNYTNKDIAKTLKITIYTVRTHKNNIETKALYFLDKHDIYLFEIFPNLGWNEQEKEDTNE